MGNRIVNGNSFSENGWPLVDFAGCDTSNVPGTNISIPIQIGIPNTILKAFLAAMNEYIEPFNGPKDQGGWTESNSVLGTPGQNDGSNHLGGTATDFNWDDHPFEIDVNDPAAGWKGSDLIDGDEVPAVRELLDYCESMVFWGADWTSPKDSMHFQMGYDTYNNIDKCMDFIKRKVDPKTMKLLWVPSWKQPQPDPGQNPVDVTTDRDKAIKALYDAVPVIEMDDSAKIVDAVISGLAMSNCNTPKRIAMWLAQVGYESDGFKATEEYGKGAGKSYAPYCGRTWIQITWQSNYAAFGAWAKDHGLVDDANIFVNNPDSLADIKWAGIGAAWYWTVQRPAINSMCDNGDLLGVTKAINGGTNGLTGVENSRTDRYNQAIALGDELLALVPTTTPTPSEGDYVPSQDEWNALNKKIDEILLQLEGKWPQNGTDPKALNDLATRASNGDPLTLNDMVAFTKAVQQGLISVKPATKLRKGTK